MLIGLLLLPATPLNADSPSLLYQPGALAQADKAKTVIVDTRSYVAYLAGRIPGAVHMGEWRQFTAAPNAKTGILTDDKNLLAAKLRAAGIDYSKTIVVYGSGTDKWRADGRFFWMFERLGFDRVGLLDGGYDAWREAGLPAERGPAADIPPSPLGSADLRLRDSVRADSQWILSRLGSPSVKIIDNRERNEYDGAPLYGVARGGHIPGALHIDWRDFYDEAGKLKPRDQLDALIGKLGLTPAHEIVVYCTGGVRSAMAFFVLRLLGFNVRNYDGSWWDWSANPSLPAES